MILDVREHVRGWVYEALMVGTRLVAIKAGCRTWTSFRRARAHYQSEGSRLNRWSDEWVRLEALGLGERVQRLRQREAAREALDLLERKVRRHQRQVRRLRAVRRRVLGEAT